MLLDFGFRWASLYKFFSDGEDLELRSKLGTAPMDKGVEVPDNAIVLPSLIDVFPGSCAIN